MEEIEKRIDNMKLKEEEEEEENESVNEPNEKLSNRHIRLMKLKNKKEEKKKNKQGGKNQNEKNQLNPDNNKDNKTNEENASLKKNNTIGDLQNEESIGLSNDNAIGENTKKMIEPVVVEYCKVCGMPYEYCEYGKYFDECKEANKEKYNYELGDTGKVDNETKKKVKKSDKNLNQKITIQKVTRAKKKVVTVITGLHSYVKLDKMTKIFSKLYACGSSVIKGTNGAPDQIDIQGDVEQLVAEEIIKNIPEITKEQIKILPPK